MGVTETSRYDDIFNPKHIENIKNIYYETEHKEAYEYMYLANASIAFSGIHELFVQVGTDVTEYKKWVNENTFWQAVNRLEEFIPEKGVFEQYLICKLDPIVTGTRNYDSLVGKLDMISGKLVFEFKFVSSISTGDKLQTLIYAAQMLEKDLLHELRPHSSSTSKMEKSSKYRSRRKMQQSLYERP